MTGMEGWRGEGDGREKGNERERCMHSMTYSCPSSRSASHTL